MKHQVFIERCRDEKPETAILLAKSIAKRYGIDPDQILSRLKEGSFRVKANLEFDAAREFMSYLEKEGALCRIIDENENTVAQSSELIVTVRGKPKKGDSSMKESAESDAKTALEASFLTMEPHVAGTELPLETPPPPPDMEYESGLSAAKGTDSSSQDLGVLAEDSAGSSRPLRLETLDGSSEEEQAKITKSSVADTSDVAAFLPPDMLEEKSLELDMDPVGPPTPAPPPISGSHAVATPPPPSGKSSRSSAATSAQEEIEAEQEEEKGSKDPPHKRMLAALSANERLRFGVGVMLAVLIGFGVVSLVASSREASKYSTVIAELRADYASATTSVQWDALDDSRATALETLEVRRRGIVMMSIFIWLVVGGLFVFLWLRIIDWTRWEEVVSDTGQVRTPAPS